MIDGTEKPKIPLKFAQRSRDNILGFDFCPQFDHPCHLKSGVPPLGLS